MNVILKKKTSNKLKYQQIYFFQEIWLPRSNVLSQFNVNIFNIVESMNFINGFLNILLEIALGFLNSTIKNFVLDYVRFFFFFAGLSWNYPSNDNSFEKSFQEIQ